MRVWILLLIAYAGFLNQVAAQSDKPKTSHISKGESFVNMKIQTTQKNRINDSFYWTKSLGIGGGYYLLNRLAIKATLMGQRYEALELLSPTLQEFNNNDLILFSGQIRYNFGEIPGWGSTFLQSGYSYGEFTTKEDLNIRRWEIISLGHTIYISEKGFRNFGMEVGVGIEKENLNKKIVLPAFVGINYYFRKNEN